MSGSSRKEQKKGRIVWVDVLRGWSILSMVAYHGMWDLVYLYGLKADWYKGLAGFVWQQSICIVFIGLAGFCWCLDSHPAKRGLLVSAGGLLVTAVTYIAAYQARVVFGVLTLIGACILLMIPLDRLLGPVRQSWPGGGTVLSFLAFVLFYHINEGRIGLAGRTLCLLPQGLYCNLFTTFLGFPMAGFYSSDYFSLLPWFFLFLTGYFLYGIHERSQAGTVAGMETSDRDQVEEKDGCGTCDRQPDKKAGTGPGRKGVLDRAVRQAGGLLAMLGRHSFLIYLLHQPLLSLVFSLLLGDF